MQRSVQLRGGYASQICQLLAAPDSRPGGENGEGDCASQRRREAFREPARDRVHGATLHEGRTQILRASRQIRRERRNDTTPGKQISMRRRQVPVDKASELVISTFETGEVSRKLP